MDEDDTFYNWCLLKSGIDIPRYQETNISGHLLDHFCKEQLVINLSKFSKLDLNNLKKLMIEMIRECSIKRWRNQNYSFLDLGMYDKSVSSDVRPKHDYFLICMEFR